MGKGTECLLTGLINSYNLSTHCFMEENINFNDCWAEQPFFIATKMLFCPTTTTPPPPPTLVEWAEWVLQPGSVAEPPLSGPVAAVHQRGRATCAALWRPLQAQSGSTAREDPCWTGPAESMGEVCLICFIRSDTILWKMLLCNTIFIMYLVLHPTSPHW